MKPLILPYNNIYPTIAKSAYIAPNAVIIGDVTIGENSNIWFNCVIRGDVAKVTIGKGTNIQDGTIIHVTRGGFNTTIGDFVTIGHMAMLHACKIEDYAFIGMNATVMDKTIISSQAMVAAGSVVTNNKIVPSGEIWAGNPAKFFRKLSIDEINHINISANNYIKLATQYQDLDLSK